MVKFPADLQTIIDNLAAVRREANQKKRDYARRDEGGDCWAS